MISRFLTVPVGMAVFHLLSTPALAQTPVGAPPPPPVQSVPPSPAAVAPTAKPPEGPAIPVPEDIVQQIKAHAEGDFGDLSRARSIGMIQSAWDDAPESAAVFTYDLDPSSTYKVRVREYMVTVLELPTGEQIEAVDLGDSRGFEVKPRGDRRLAIRAGGFGFDSNIVVYGKSGTVYPIYLRAEGYNSKRVPDLLVRIDGSVKVGPDSDPAVPGFEPLGAGAPSSEPLPLVPPQALAEAAKAAGSDDTAGDGSDFVKSAPFNPSSLRGWGDYSLWGSDDSLKPQTVYRDDHFTYIKFGDRWKDIELPTAYVVVDSIDELVNTRVDGDTFIVESTRPLITLKSGNSHLCIRYDGAEAGA